MCLSLNFDLSLVMTNSLDFTYEIPFLKRLPTEELDIFRTLDIEAMERRGRLMFR